MSDSEDEVNIDISQWKPRTVNAAPEPPAPAPRTFASINAPAAAPATTNHLDDDDFDIDAIIEGIADPDDALQSKAPTPPPTKTIRKPRQTVQVVITRDPNFNRHDYIDCTYGANIVRHALKEIAKNQDVYYNVEFVDRHTEQVSILHYYPIDPSPEALPILSHTNLPLLEGRCTSRFTFSCHSASLFTLLNLHRGLRAYLIHPSLYFTSFTTSTLPQSKPL